MRPAALLPALALLLSAAACRREQTRVVGVVPKGANHIFWQTVHAGAIKAAREFGFEIEWNAPAVEVDSSRQIDIVDSMINRRLAGIVLAPVDKNALVAVVERAGRRVSRFPSSIPPSTPASILSFVATNNNEGRPHGRAPHGRNPRRKGQSRRSSALCPAAPPPWSAKTDFRTKSARSFPAFDIVGLQFGMADRAKAMAETENLLTAYPDLAGLFADNESSSSGAVQALKSRGVKSVRLVAFDASDQLLADLRAGVIDSIVVQNPFRMGYESTRAIGLHLRGETPPRNLDSGESLIRREDLERPEVRQLLFPDIQSYLHTKP